MNVPFGVRLVMAIVMPLLIVNRGYKKKSLSFSGACSSLVVGFLLTFSSLCFFSSLFTFFVLASCVTKLRADVKRNIEYDFKEGGQRNWVQVICNGGVAAFASVLYLVEVGCGERPIDFARDFNASIFSMALLGSLACSSGDTWASEIGTNGGVTVVGTLASIVGGGVVGVTYYLSILAIMTYKTTLDKFPPQWPIVVTGVLGVFCGHSLTHSLDHEPSASTKHICGRALLSNHGVNFVSSLVTAFVMPVVGYFVEIFVKCKIKNATCMPL